MADKSDDRTILDCLGQIFILADLNAKMVIACRSNYFRSHSQLFDAVRSYSIVLDAPDGTRRSTSLARHGQTVTLNALSPTRVQEFIQKRFPTLAEARVIQEAIGAIHDLTDLCARPVLLDMILETLPSLVQTEAAVVNSATLYEDYTDRWYARDEWRVQTPLRIRRAFCNALAWSMLSRQMDDISYGDLRAAVELSLQTEEDSSSHIETFSNDIQTCSFLVRSTQSDRYSFAHRSFMEYLVARRLIEGLASGSTIDVLVKGLTPKPRRIEPDQRWPRSARASDLSTDQPRKAIDHMLRLVALHTEASSLSIPYVSWSGDIGGFFDARLTSSGLSFEWARQARRAGGIESLEEALESHVLEVFRDDSVVSTGLPFAIGPEIATFAVEHLATRGSTPSQLAAATEGRLERLVLCDVLRRAQSPSYFASRSEDVWSYVRQGTDMQLRTALAGGLARNGGVSTVEDLRALRFALSGDGFSYVFSVLASKQSPEAVELLLAYRSEEGTSPLDELIVLHSARSTIGEAEYIVGLSAVAKELAREDDTARLLSAVTVELMLPVGDALNVADLILASDSVSHLVKLEAIEYLSRFDSVKAASGIRRLRIKYRGDERIRRKLQAAEDSVKNLGALSRQRQLNPGHMARRGIDDHLWKALRV